MLGDAVALSRVVANLVVNAIQYNRPGGEVEVLLVVDGEEALLTVRDTGPGIPAEHQAQVFERFYRADKARSRATGGSGLGLAIAKAIVEAHRGSIGFASNRREGHDILGPAATDIAQRSQVNHKPVAPTAEIAVV